MNKIEHGETVFRFSVQSKSPRTRFGPAAVTYSPDKQQARVSFWGMAVEYTGKYRGTRSEALRLLKKMIKELP